jgi:hypothetical protein
MTMVSRVGFVSCDLIDYSKQGIRAQATWVAGVNEIVKETLGAVGERHAFWASRGDGGHAVFRHEDWPTSALRLIAKLRAWSIKVDAPLRITAHAGEILEIEGADGRPEMAGDGINLASALLAHGWQDRVIVSRAAYEAFEAARLPGVRCHDERTLPAKHFPPQVLCLLSLAGEFQSAWSSPSPSDRELLIDAARRKSGWEVIYHAKRLMQFNESDTDAVRALNSLGPLNLTFDHPDTGEREVNPLLGLMDKPARIKFVSTAELVERQAGDTLCEMGDEGNSMFVILRGEVGIVVPGPHSIVGSAPSMLTRSRRPGEMVGELALVLKRERTATMQALEPTALLSFSFHHLQSLLRSGEQINLTMNRFFDKRVLEHVCTNVSYLVGGPGRDGPLAHLPGHPEPWDSMLEQTARITIPWQETRRIHPDDDWFRADGLYVLVSGTIQDPFNSSRLMDGYNLPIIYADFPGEFVRINHPFIVKRDAVILRIPAEAFTRFGAEAFGRMLEEIKRAMAEQSYYDVFLSYSHKDIDVAYRWRDSLERCGLVVFLDDATRKGHHFPPELAAALLDSLFLMPLVSANTMERPPAENWVLREINFRTRFFETRSSNVLPIKLTGGRVESIGDGFAAIDAIGREEEALAEAIAATREVRGGRR